MIVWFSVSVFSVSIGFLDMFGADLNKLISNDVKRREL